MDVTARVLGPLEVVVDGIDVTPRAPKEQALLATLVLRARQVVPADRLCEELWPGLDGDKARHALHVRVGCVRKLLAAADAASILQRVPPGYRLDVDAASLDERRFLALVEQARADLMGNEPAAALTSLDAADRLDQPFLRWQATLMRAHCALLAGDTSEAEARAIEALDIGTRSGQPDADIIFAGQIAGVNMQRGVFPGDTVAVLQQLRVQLPGYRDTLAAVLAWEHARLGRLELAQELLDEFGASGFEPMPEPNGWLFTMIDFADVAVACGDHEAAAALYEGLEPFPAHVAGTGGAPYPPVHHYLGKLAALLLRYERAEAHFTAAAEFAERAGAAYFAAETDLAWGTMLAQRRDRGDARRARTHLDSARSVAVDGGYAGVERRAAAMLESLA